MASAASRVDTTRLADPGRELGGGTGESKKAKGRFEDVEVYKERDEHPELERTRVELVEVEGAAVETRVRGRTVYSRLWMV